MKCKGTVRKVLALVRMLQPGYLTLLIITKIIAAAYPFVYILFSSMILDLLVERASYGQIMEVVLWLSGISGALVLSRWGLEMAVDVKKRVLEHRVNLMMCEKSFSIDYEILDSNETMDIRQKAYDGVRSSGSIVSFCETLAGALEQLCGIVYSLVLLVPLFLPGGAPARGWLAGLLDRWYGAVFLLVAMALSMWANTSVNRQVGRLQQEGFEANVQNNRRINYFQYLTMEYSQGKYIRLYRMQNMILKEIRKNIDAMEKVGKNIAARSRRLKWLTAASALGLQLASYLYVGLKAIYGLISLGSVLRYVSAYQNLCQGVGSIFDLFVKMEVRSRYLAYFYDYLSIPNRRYEGTLPIEKRDDNEYEIEFKDVSFHYPNSQQMVLSHVNEKIRLGSRMAVVGRNGAGKSTFIKLLCRLYEPTEGEILLNGVNIQYYDYNEYSKLFAVVFQDFRLFSFSIAENVAASRQYNEERVLECIEKAGFADRLRKLPEGIHTNIYQLEENGAEISGGEAQKLAIARALYKDAPWVILDEPTSALDPVAEFEIYRHFDELVRDRTAIYISHRMSSCRFCDMIYVFDGGRIVQKGSHEALLLEEGSLYSRLWNAQARYYQRD
mgnify:FL=1